MAGKILTCVQEWTFLLKIYIYNPPILSTDKETIILLFILEMYLSSLMQQSYKFVSSETKLQHIFAAAFLVHYFHVKDFCNIGFTRVWTSYYGFCPSSLASDSPFALVKGWRELDTSIIGFWRRKKFAASLVRMWFVNL